jgi:hypothetical protein
MARLKQSRKVKWAGVEFQPDLTKPVKPVRLGVILIEDGKAIAVRGRLPNPIARPAEFKEVGAVTISLAAKWVDNMFKDILEGEEGKIFDRLGQRWRWNLYLVKEKTLKSTEAHGALEVIASRVYEKFVGEPFKAAKQTKPKSAPKRDTVARGSRPLAWQLETVNRESTVSI